MSSKVSPEEFDRTVRMCEAMARTIYLQRRPGIPAMLGSEDLEAAARLGVVAALKAYDPSRGWRFSTFAFSTARGYVLHAIRDVLHLPRQDRQHLPGWHERRAQAEAIAYPESLDFQHATGDRACELVPSEAETPEQALDREADREALWGAVSRLQPHHAEVITLLYREELSQREVGERLGVTQMTISRWRRQALFWLGRELQDCG